MGCSFAKQPPAELDEPALTLLGELSDADLARLFASDESNPSEEWKKHGGEELEPLLRFTTLVDARWLLKLARRLVLPKRNGVVQPWQQLPAAAVVPLSLLRSSEMTDGLPVGVMSYGCEAAVTQPEATGFCLLSAHARPPTLTLTCPDAAAGAAKGHPDPTGRTGRVGSG